MSSTKTQLGLFPVAPTLDGVQAYYDERVERKVRDFAEPNPRIEAAIQTLAEWAPSNPKRILEIGCGIGATSWRMARAWPQAEVLGVDVSSKSIKLAQKCFRARNLAYQELLLRNGVLSSSFDYIVLMDVYEHISVVARAEFHAGLASVFSRGGRMFLSFPTPEHLQFLKLHRPAEIQPVDEDITPSVLHELADDLEARLLFYKSVSIWSTHDYAHAVVGRDATITTGPAAANRTLFGSVRETIGRTLKRRAFYVSRRERRTVIEKQHGRT